MIGVYLAASSVSASWGQILVLALSLVVVVAICQKAVVRAALLVVLVVALTASVAMAIPYSYCDPVWKWLGWC